jgi:hypothetical protein
MELHLTKTHCMHGHELTRLNIYVNPSGRRDCRICRRERMRKFKKARAANRLAERLRSY